MQILNHAWLTDSPAQDFSKRTRNDPTELRKLLNSSKERDSPFGKIEDRSKRKKPLELGPDKLLLRTAKDLTGKLGHTMGRAKLERTMTNPTRDESSLSSKKPKPEPQVKMADLLKLSLKKRSEEKSKCKSHRS